MSESHLEWIAVFSPIGGIVVAVMLWKSWAMSAWMLLGMTIAYAWIVDVPGVSLGIMIYPMDVASALAFLIGALRLLARRNNSDPVLFYLLSLLFAVSFALGLMEYGKSAGVDFRTIFAYLAGTLLFVSHDLDSNAAKRMTKIWIVVASVLALIAWTVWTLDAAGIGLARKWIDADPTGVQFRVLNASTTYVIGVGFLMHVHRLMCVRGEIKFWPLSIALGATVVVLQHRSVWGATLVGVAVLVMLARTGRKKLMVYATVLSLCGLIAIPFYADDLSGVWRSVSLQAERATELRTGTVGGRLHAWAQVWNEWIGLGLGQQLVGKPFGSSYAGLKNVPHNCYLQVMYRTGYVGLFIMLAVYVQALRGLLSFRTPVEIADGDFPLLFVAILVGQLAFFMPYSFTPEQGILMGVALALPAARRRIASRSVSKIADPIDSLVAHPNVIRRSRAKILS